MKAFLRNLSIKRKLIAISTLTATIALFLACGAFVNYELVTYRESAAVRLLTMAQMIEGTSTAALAFGDARAATETLNTLSRQSHILEAALYGRDGVLLASYARTPLAASIPPRPSADGTRFGVANLSIFYPVRLENDRIGTVYLKGDLTEMNARLFQYAGIALIVFIASILAAFAISSVLQRLISGPILRLAETASRVSRERNYRIRTEKFADDETGVLVDRFNEMLEQIHARDKELQTAKNNLEQRVRERTDQLLEAKETLEQRVLERTAQLQEQITAKDLAHAELAAAQQRLMELSRQAGMAEIATGVLHNVGNVLNSVNVSTTLITDKIRESRVDNLLSLAQMLDQHSGDLPEFLENDPKGQRAVPYLVKLCGHFQAERNDLLKELDLLSSHVGHIKQIVAAQQNYAKGSSITERVSMSGMVDNALKIFESGMDCQRIRVERDFEPVPDVVVDKHKIVQIVLNLLRNAAQALPKGYEDRAVIRIRIRQLGESRISLAVEDTGVGLAPENLTRIFGYGFTTKADGHGFGLHSCALAASQMGGSLRAESEGLGHGATFILELPLSVTSNIEVTV